MSTPLPTNKKGLLDLPAEPHTTISTETSEANNITSFSIGNFIPDFEKFPRTFDFYIGGPYSLPMKPPGYENPIPSPHATEFEAYWVGDPPISPNLVQKVHFATCMRTKEISASAGKMNPPLDLDIIKFFGGSDVVRELCSVELQFAGNQFFWDMGTDPALFRALGGLIGFKKVVVRLNVQDFEAGERLTCHPEGGYVQVQNVLERSLGPARYYGGDWEERRLEFRPLEYVQRVRS